MCEKRRNLMLSRRLTKFLNKFQNVFVKNEKKIDKFVSNYRRYIDLRITRRSFCKYQRQKKSHTERLLPDAMGEVLLLICKNYM